MTYQYTDWMAQFTEAEKIAYSAMAKKNFQNLTVEEEALLTRWNVAKQVFEDEIAEIEIELQSKFAISRANAIAAFNQSIAYLENLVTEIINGGDDDGEQK